MERRQFLRGGVAGLGALAAFPNLACTAAPEPAPGALFHLGVASGVHSADAVVLWTRIDPRVATPSAVGWQVAGDPGFSTILATGTADVSAGSDYCVKVLAEGLPTNASVWYRFTAGSETSPTGRARTLPAVGQPLDSLRLAFASCQMYSTGYYGAWRFVAQSDLDAVVFLGDYIYEMEIPLIGVRRGPDGIASSLAEYRNRYRTYRSDPWLQAAHAAHPFITVWDDHEVFNNVDSVDMANDPTRAAAAHQAWFEYQPVWPIDGTRIYNDLRWGDLAHLAMLDSRQYRSRKDESFNIIGGTLTPALAAPDRTMLGTAQRDWLISSISGASHDGVTWPLLGNPVMLAPFRLVDLDTPQTRALDPNLIRHQGIYVSSDGWDGYSAERDTLLTAFHEGGVANLTVLTGDYHAFFKNPIRVDFDADDSPVIAHEYVTSSIASIPFNLVEAAATAGGAQHTSPAVEYADTTRNGIGVVEMTPDSQTVTFYAHDARLGSARSPYLPRPSARWVRQAGSATTTKVPAS